MIPTSHFTFTFIVYICIITEISTENGDCGPKFKNKCWCGKGEYDNREQYIVNCTNTGFTDTSVLENVPEETQVVIFTGNYIPELPWNVFGTINDLSSLEIVDMSNNHIRDIRGKSYHHVQNVRRLILNHNNLSISNADDDYNRHHPRVFSNFLNLMELHLSNAFADNSSAELSRDLHDIFVNSNLTKLHKLHLEQNEITRFADPQVFCDLPSLMDLHLGDNNLKELNFDIMCIPHLRFLDLERNKFEYVKPRDLTALDMVQKKPKRDTDLIVDFTYNPFVCDCGIAGLQEWLKTTNVSVRNKDYLSCFRNKRYEEKIIGLQTGKCKLVSQRTNTTAAHTTTLLFLLTFLIFVLLGLIVALAYLSRDRILSTFRPVLTNVSKKVHYTTIKDEDCTEVHV